MDEVGVKVWVFVATIFFSPKHSNITKIQKNRKKTSGVQKVHAPNIEGSPPKNHLDVSHFFYSPLARQKGGGSTLPPPPPAFEFIFCSHPTLGAPYFYPVDNGYPSGVTSHSKK
jgi:hypothetical protein